MNSRRSVAAFAIISVVLLVMAPGAQAINTTAQTTETVVGSQHDTQSDFQNSQELTNLTTTSSGTVELETGGSYNVIDDSGDGTVDNTRNLLGDTGTDSTRGVSLKAVPNFGGDVEQITVSIGGVQGSDYDSSVDIYAVQESEPDGTVGEGTLIKSGWNPDWQTGEQTITLDSSFSVQDGESWIIEFDTTSSDNDGTIDSLEINMDDSFTSPWWSNSAGTTVNEGGDMTLTSTQNAASARYVSPPHNVTDPEEAAINITQATNVSIDATVQTSGGTVLNQTTLSGTGNHTLSLASTSSDQLETVLDITKTGDNPSFELADDSILFSNHAPEASNLSPPDGTQLTERNVDFSVDVSDEEFGTAQGDSVEAALHIDGQEVGSETVTSNQTVTVTEELVEGGDHTYHWELTDSYGATTTTSTRTVTVPATLEVRDVTNTSKLVDGDNATVTFYGGDQETQIVERPVENGTVDLSGLPTDTEFTVVVRADDYYTRQTIIPSLYDQANVWMLPRNETDAVEIVFLLDDRTGEFANSDSTQLRVQRAIEHNGSMEWRDVVGDDISATAELATILEDQQRYRLVISNDVQSRILGSYTPSGPADPETVPIGRIDFQGDSPEGTAFDANVVNETSPAVQWTYRDPDSVADSLTYRIVNVTDSSNETVVVSNTTISDPEEFTSVTEPLPSNATLEGSTYRVELWAYQNGELVDERAQNVGKLTGPGDWSSGIHEGLLNLGGFVFLVGAGYGTANYNPRLGAVVSVVLASTLVLFNVVHIAPVILGFTGTIALIANAADTT